MASVIPGAVRADLCVATQAPAGGEMVTIVSRVSLAVELGVPLDHRPDLVLSPTESHALCASPLELDGADVSA